MTVLLGAESHLDDKQVIEGIIYSKFLINGGNLMIGKGRIVFTVFCITALMFYSLTSMAGEWRKAGNEKGKEALPGANVQRMANTELASLIGVPDVVIIDVDNASNWGSRKSIIKGAIIMGAAYFDPIFNFIVQYPKDKTYVLYGG